MINKDEIKREKFEIGFFGKLKSWQRLFERRSKMMSTLCKYEKLIATNNLWDKSLAVRFDIESVPRKERGRAQKKLDHQGVISSVLL